MEEIIKVLKGEEETEIKIEGNISDVSCAVVHIVENIHKELEEMGGKQWADEVIDLIAEYAKDPTDEKEKMVARKIKNIAVFSVLKEVLKEWSQKKD